MKCPSCKHKWQSSGVKPLVTDQQFIAAYKKNAGVIQAVAEQLGLKYPTVYAMARRRGLKGQGHAGQRRYPKLTEQKAIEAWNEGKSIKKGAAILGVPFHILYARLVNAKEFRENRTRFIGLTARKRVVSEIVKVLAKTKGNYSEAALLLGISRERMRQLVERDVVGGLVAGK